MNTLDNSVAIVTGAAMGIGGATASRLAAAGARVVVADIDEQAGRAKADEISGMFVRCDVSRAQDAENVAAQAFSSFGRIDILVNNAGIQRYGTVVDTSEETWDLVMGVNLKAMFLMSKFCIPHMLSGAGGSIVNVASVQGLATQKSVAAYAASKGAVITLTKSMSHDFAPDVRTNAVCPGAVQTPMMDKVAELRKGVPSAPEPSEEASDVPIADPSQIAEVIAFLASPAASFVTGSIVVADGGLMSILPEV